MGKLSCHVRIMVLCLLLGVVSNLHAQLNQVIKGFVVDTDNKIPLPGANVVVLGTNPVLGTITGIDGFFKIENVPVGRHSIQITFIGYEPVIIYEVLLSSGKELVLDIELKESVLNIEGVTVKAYKKGAVINEMATLSAKTFTVEETQKYAGGMADPGRLVTAYAGVTQTNTSNNGIVIRGNAPKGVLWRLEGVEIPNPNHFGESMILGGGFVTALSSQVIGNSGFYTGAFPAEYGNALSGVFDIKLRKGNNEKRESTFEAGVIGLDIASEGPFIKGKNATYLFNYRYSTFSLINYMLPYDELPEYQNLTFNIDLPTKKAGMFNIWGFGGLEKMEEQHEEDSANWLYRDDMEDYYFEGKFGAIGLSHRYIMNEKRYVKTSIVMSGRYGYCNESYLDNSMNMNTFLDAEKINYKISLNSLLNNKFSPKHTNRTGIILNAMNYDVNASIIPKGSTILSEYINENDHGGSFQIYTQSSIRLAELLSINAGIHLFHFGITNQTSLEPRIGIKGTVYTNHNISMAYGLHSQSEMVDFYLVKKQTQQGIIQPNKNLKLSKAHHFVIGYDFSINENIRLSVEPYYQYLYDIPVIKDGNFSMLNFEEEDGFMENLVNSGTGYNYGIDFTLERFLNKGYYYLISASLFDSKYIADDNIKRNTLYNRNFVADILGGKEWFIGNKNMLSINGRLYLFNGRRYTPVNMTASLQENHIVYDNSRIFAEKYPFSYRLDITVSYRINRSRYSSVWSLQYLNVLRSKDRDGFIYNIKRDRIDELCPVYSIPAFSYKVEF